MNQRFGPRNKQTREETIKRLVLSAVMLGVATTLEIVSNFIPLELPFGGRITIVSMLPIVLVGYMYGVSQGVFTAFCFSVIQMLLGEGHPFGQQFGAECRRKMKKHFPTLRQDCRQDRKRPVTNFLNSS